MQRSNFFLRTKLLPPRAVAALLDRPRLTNRLESNLNSPVTLVAADAGCGKTTLIADFVRKQSRPTVWYQLDHTDADPVVFLGYIAHGIQNFVPGFGENLFPYLSEASEEVSSFPERAVDLLINEILDTIETPFILVLDDYHHIGRETVVHKLLDRLVQYSSDLIHLIITTRDMPPLALMRRRSQASAMVIDRDDLLFTDVEVRELFKNTLSVDLTDEEIVEYRGRTHGWITALQLVRQIAEQEIHAGKESYRPDLRGILQRSERDIFDYFAEEVLARETAETQRFLTHVSLLDTLPLDLCSELYPEMRCSAALPELAQKNIFLTVAGDGRSSEEYRFHPLFREFLTRRLRSEVGQAEVALQRNRIGEHYLARGQWELALPYLLEAQNFERAAELIAEKGNDWFATGAFTSLGMSIDGVPIEFLSRHPRSLLIRAEIARIQGELDRSSNLLNRAVKLLNADKDVVGEAEALHSLASLARRKGNLHEAFELLEKAEGLVPHDSETFLKCANTRGLCLIVQGNQTRAEQQFRIALELAEKRSNEHYVRLVAHNLALGPGFRGDFSEALRWFKRIFRDIEPESQLPQEAIGHLNVARLHLYRGEFDDTQKHLDKAIELCQLYNLNSLRGEIFEAYANLYREKLDLAHAEEYYERALGAYDAADIDPSTRELFEERAKLFLLNGNRNRARTSLENLIRAREQRSGELAVNTARLLLLRVDLIDGRTDGLPDKIEPILSSFHERGNYYDEALASMLMAESLFRLGRVLEMTPYVQRALDLSARFDYEYWLRGEIKRSPELFSVEEVFDRLPADLQELAHESTESKKADLPSETDQAAPAFADLTIKVLGPVEICRDVTKPFAADAWTTKRARDIFCYIATSKHRRVAKDVLIDTFWPDDDPATIEKNFHPTISHIRKALNHRQAFKQNFLLFRDGAYQLNPELSYSIDTEDFELQIAEAEIAKREKDSQRLRRGLESALASYRGEFMPSVYENWADERRNYYAEQYLRVLAAMAKMALTEKRLAAAVKYATELLGDDPFREDIHRLVMKAFAAQGKPAAVKKQYEDLSDLLKKELGIQPAAETERLYRELQRNGDEA
jgi:LuxR family maltose regulon positive regulatory protein